MLNFETTFDKLLTKKNLLNCNAILNFNFLLNSHLLFWIFQNVASLWYSIRAGDESQIKSTRAEDLKMICGIDYLERFRKELLSGRSSLLGLQQLGLILNFVLSRTDDSKLIIRRVMEFITWSDKISKNLFFKSIFSILFCN